MLRITGLVLLLLLSGCTGGERVDGLFNNDDERDRGIATHLAAWQSRLGNPADPRRVQTLVSSRGGECAREPPGLLVCAVNVEPRYPSVFKTRILWVMRFAQEPGGRLRIADLAVDHLGWDL